ncbi:hypothetical protein CFS9_39200 [Flavobacterium sp. CFS9]|uniref:Lipoprotein n=1 Tax=Flavobacterium sp. CFS9 TaxID=3143118 RepID=A0AAT9H794_9FLAO
MRNKFFGIIIIIIFVACKPQERTAKSRSCSGEVTIQYDKVQQSDKSKLIANKSLNSFTVYFLSNYRDTIQGYVNDKKKFEKFVDLDDNSDSMKEKFIYDYSQDKEIPALKIISKTTKNCFDILIDKKYKIIYVFKNNDKWIVRFSNIYYVN